MSSQSRVLHPFRRSYLCLSPIITLEHVSKDFEANRASEDVTVTIQPGEFIAVLGKSGAGKTTLLRCLACSTRVTEGVIRFGAQDLTALHGAALRRHRARVGMISQQFHLVRRLRVMDNVLIGRLPHLEGWRQWAAISTHAQPQTFESIRQAYMSRRTLLQGAVSSLVLAYASPLRRSDAAAGDAGFTPLTHSTEDKLLAPPGYEYQVLLRWGDPISADTPGVDPRGQTPAKQARQFGYNTDPHSTALSPAIGWILARSLPSPRQAEIDESNLLMGSAVQTLRR